MSFTQESWENSVDDCVVSNNPEELLTTLRLGSDNLQKHEMIDFVKFVLRTIEKEINEPKRDENIYITENQSYDEIQTLLFQFSRNLLN